MDTASHPPAWKTLTAFAIIYLVWGSTYLAIRVGVREVPPFLLAALRFLIAGIVLFAWMLAKGERPPNRREWRSIAILASLIFLVDYGCVFWAEQRVPSGITAVLLATIPVFMTLAEIIFLRTQRLTARLAVALLIGLAGVAALVSRTFRLGGEPIDPLGAVALMVASVSWSASAVLTRRLPLPPSKGMSSGAQMLAGGAMLLAASAIFGEFPRFDPGAVTWPAWFSLAYLIVAGSIVAFTAYVWLIDHQSPTRVGTYAYVNPVVAVVIGYFLGGEPIDARTVSGTLSILVSVVLIAMRTRTTRAAAKATS